MSAAPARDAASLIERAAAQFDFTRDFRAPVDDAALAPAPLPRPIRNDAVPRAAATPGVLAVDRAMLAERGLLVPGAPVAELAEEFRLVKRQLLLTARAVKAEHADLARSVVVCSANPDEGKTYCAVNLAISLAAERDVEVLLVDADFVKPDVMARLGGREGRGLLDALADPAVDIEACVVRTDIPQLSLLPAGTKSINDTELLASGRTPQLIARLLAADARRLIVFDSPPALAASPAAVLATLAGQVVLVVRADRTHEGDLRQAVALLDGCDHIQLLLNAVSFQPGGRRFGSYYGLEDGK